MAGIEITNRALGNDISCSIKQDSSNWTGFGQLIFNTRFTLVWFGLEDFDSNNLHNSATQSSGTALGTHEATTLQDTTQSWTIDQFAGKAIKISSGGADGEVHRIVSNTSDTITIVTGWVASISDGDAYEISDACQIVIPSSGKYLVPGRFTFSNSALGIRGIAIYKNNVFLDNYFALPVGTVESAIKNQAFAYEFEKGDIVEFYAYQSTGANLALLSFGLRNRFQVIAQRGV